MIKILRPIVLVAWISMRAAPAAAHVDSTGAGPVYDGVWHVLSAPELLAPLMAISLAAGLTSRQIGRHVIALLSLGWLLGSGVASAMPAASPWLALASVSVTLALGGGALLLGKRPALLLKIGAIAVSAISGFTSATGYGLTDDGILIIGGETGAAVAIGFIAAATGVSLRARGLDVAARYAGSCVLAMGLVMAAWSFKDRSQPVRTQAPGPVSDPYIRDLPKSLPDA